MIGIHLSRNLNDSSRPDESIYCKSFNCGFTPCFDILDMNERLELNEQKERIYSIYPDKRIGIGYTNESFYTNDL